MNVADLMLSAGEADALALLQESEKTSYAELRCRVWGVASRVAALDGDVGDRVALSVENGTFFVAAYLGIIHAGRVAVPLNPQWHTDTLTQVMASAAPTALLASRRQAARLRRTQAASLCPLVAEDEVAPCERKPDAVQVNAAQALAALMFTSGSTGEPKGVMVTHRNIECNTRDVVDYVGLTAADRAMLVLPLHYCFGLSVLHTHLLAGASVVINNQFLYPEAVLQDMHAKSCTGLAGVPSTYQILLRKSRFKAMDFPSLRWLQQAGGRLPNPCIEELRRAFPQVRFFTMYGQTEATARLSFLPPERLEDKLGSIGRGLPSARLEVLKSDGSPAVPGSEEAGEIVAAGDNVCAGYWNDPEETARYFRDGKLYTGDLARVDSEGFIFIVDRERDMIKSGGNRISAKEIEDVICEVSDVVEAAVIGVPDELMGEAIAAFVVLTPHAQIDAEAILLHCRKRLPAFKVPHQCLALDRLPHNSSGKVIKHALRKCISEQVALGRVREITHCDEPISTVI